MPALIDNYTTVKHTRPHTARELYTIEPDTSTFSIIVSIRKPIGLNGRIFMLLKEFSKLENNWDGEGALAPDSAALERAKYLTNLLEGCGQPIFHAAPGPNGEIMLDIRNLHRNRGIELIFYPDHSTVVFFQEVGLPTQEDLDYLRLPTYLSWLNE